MDDNEVRARLTRLLLSYALIKRSKVLIHLDDQQLLKVLIYCDMKGWLHYKYEQDTLVFVACGYNIPEFVEGKNHILPVKSEGDVLYVPFVVSIAKDKTLPKQAISEYLKEHPNTRTVVFYKDDAEKPTIFNRKGDSDGEEKSVESTTTACTELSA
jgi:hypothetical protein